MHFSTSERQKVVRTCPFLTLLTWKCASHHNGVNFFDISTSKSGPNPSVFYTFTLLTWTCAWRNNGVHFFDISTFTGAPKLTCFFLHVDLEMCFARVRVFDITTSKSGPSLVCFGNFDFEMCFAPQRPTSKRAPSVWCFFLFYFQMRFLPQRRTILHVSFDHMAPHPPL